MLAVPARSGPTGPGTISSGPAGPSLAGPDLAGSGVAGPSPVGPSPVGPSPAGSALPCGPAAGERADLAPPLKFITAPDDAGTWSRARGLSKENSA